jgi:hypothetical protein
VINYHSSTFLFYLISELPLSGGLFDIIINNIVYCESLLLELETNFTLFLDYSLILICYFLGLLIYKNFFSISLIIDFFFFIVFYGLLFFIIFIGWFLNVHFLDWITFFFDNQAVVDTLSDQFDKTLSFQYLGFFVVVVGCFTPYYLINFICLSVLLFLGLENFILSVGILLIYFCYYLIFYLQREYLL